ARAGHPARNAAVRRLGARRLPLRLARRLLGSRRDRTAVGRAALHRPAGLSRAFTAEREQGVIDGLVLAPSDRSAIWLGKPLAVPIVVGGVGASVAAEPARYIGLLGLYDALFAIICWASFEYVVTE